MVTMTVYADVEGFCWIVNTLNRSFDTGYKFIDVRLKRNRKYQCEIQVPIQAVGGFSKKNMTTVSLHDLVRK